MNHKLLHISLERYSNASPETNVWNIFDSEHPPYIHAKRQAGEGMDPSFILYESGNFNVTLDTQRLPLLSFIRYRSVMVHIATPDNSVVQYSSFFGVPTLQKYSAVAVENGRTKFNIDVVFYLTGFWKLLSPIIKKYVTFWLSKTWEEDLVMKQRRQKFLDLGFKDMRGLPDKVSERKGKVQKLTLPVPRAKSDVDAHPFCWKNLASTLSDRPPVPHSTVLAKTG
jgi:hypothetical protein